MSGGLDHDSRLKNLEQRASMGDADAIYQLAFAYHNGTLGLSVNFDSARAFYSQIVHQSSISSSTAPKSFPVALNNLGVMANLGHGQPVDTILAAQYFLRASDCGHPMAMRNLGLLLSQSRLPSTRSSNQQDDCESDSDDEEYQPNTDSDSVNSSSPAAASSVTGSFPRWRLRLFQSKPPLQLRRNVRVALYWLDKAAANGVADAMADSRQLILNEIPRIMFLHSRGKAQSRHYLMLGDWCVSGRLASGNPAPKAAVCCWELAAASGDVPALRRLARLFEHGCESASFPADQRRTLLYLEQAALMGDTEAQSAVMAKLPVTIWPTYERAFAGDFQSILCIGIMYENGSHHLLAGSEVLCHFSKRLVLIYLLRAALHPSIVQSVLKSFSSHSAYLDEFKMLSQASASLGLLPARFTLSNKPSESTTSSSASVAWFQQSTINSFSLPVPRLRSFQPLLPAHVLHSSQLISPSSGSIQFFRAQMPMPDDLQASNHLPQLHAIRAWSTKLNLTTANINMVSANPDIGSSAAPALDSWYPFSAQLSAANFPSASLAAQAANNAAAILDSPVSRSLPLPRFLTEFSQFSDASDDEMLQASCFVFSCPSSACLLLGWASALGLTEAQKNLGAMFATGRADHVCPVDFVQPLTAFESSSIDSQTVPSSTHSRMLQSSCGVPLNEIMACHFLAGAAARGNQQAFSSLCTYLNPETAEIFVLSVIGHVRAQLAIGMMYDRGDSKHMRINADFSVKSMGFADSAPSVISSSLSSKSFHSNGFGIVASAQAARFWYQTALCSSLNQTKFAALGSNGWDLVSRAACNLAVLYDNDDNSSSNSALSRSCAEAIELFNWSAECGNAWALKNLGSIFHQGRRNLVQIDLEKALTFYIRAFLTDSRLSVCLKSIQQIWPDIQRKRIDDEVSEYCETMKRAEAGDPNAMLALAICYFRGPRTFQAQTPLVASATFQDLQAHIMQPLSQLTAFLRQPPVQTDISNSHHHHPATDSKPSSEAHSSSSKRSSFPSKHRPISRSFSQVSFLSSSKQLSKPSLAPSHIPSASSEPSFAVSASSQTIESMDGLSVPKAPWSVADALLFCTAILPTPPPLHTAHTESEAVIKLLTDHNLEIPGPAPRKSPHLSLQSIASSTTVSSSVSFSAIPVVSNQNLQPQIQLIPTQSDSRAVTSELFHPESRHDTSGSKNILTSSLPNLRNRPTTSQSMKSLPSAASSSSASSDVQSSDLVAFAPSSSVFKDAEFRPMPAPQMLPSKTAFPAVVTRQKDALNKSASTDSLGHTSGNRPSTALNQRQTRSLSSSQSKSNLVDAMLTSLQPPAPHLASHSRLMAHSASTRSLLLKSLHKAPEKSEASINRSEVDMVALALSGAKQETSRPKTTHQSPALLSSSASAAWLALQLSRNSYQNKKEDLSYIAITETNISSKTTIAAVKPINSSSVSITSIISDEIPAHSLIAPHSSDSHEFLPRQAFVQSFARAFEWLERLQHYLDARYRSTEISNDSVDVERLQTHVWSMMGALFDQGWAVPHQPARALQLWRQSAANGDPWAMRNLGLMYQFGRPGLFSPDLGAALLWYERSAMGGCHQGRELLIRLMPEMVASLWSQAVAGDPKSQVQFASLLSRGWSSIPRPHPNMPFEWYQRAWLQNAIQIKFLGQNESSPSSTSSISLSGILSNAAFRSLTPWLQIASFSSSFRNSVSESRSKALISSQVDGMNAPPSAFIQVTVPQLMLLYSRLLHLAADSSLMASPDTYARSVSPQNNRLRSSSTHQISSPTPSNSSSSPLSTSPNRQRIPYAPIDLKQNELISSLSESSSSGLHWLPPQRSASPASPLPSRPSTSHSNAPNHHDSSLKFSNTQFSFSPSHSRSASRGGFGSMVNGADSGFNPNISVNLTSSASVTSLNDIPMFSSAVLTSGTDIGKHGLLRWGRLAQPADTVAVSAASVLTHNPPLYQSYLNHTLSGSIVVARPSTASSITDVNRGHQLHSPHSTNSVRPQTSDGIVPAALYRDASHPNVSAVSVSSSAPRPLVDASWMLNEDRMKLLQSNLNITEDGKVLSINGSTSAWKLSVMLIAGTSTSMAVSMNSRSSTSKQPQFEVENIWSQCLFHIRDFLSQVPYVDGSLIPVPIQDSLDSFSVSLQNHYSGCHDINLQVSREYAPFSVSSVAKENFFSNSFMAPSSGNISDSLSSWCACSLSLAEIWSKGIRRSEADIFAENSESSGHEFLVRAEPLRSFCLWHVAAATGSAEAVRNIGLAFASGISDADPRDLSSSAELIARLHPNSTIRHIDASAMPLKPNVVLAAEWLAEASLLGDAEARRQLDDLMSPSIAEMFISALGGDSNSQFALALMYECGYEAFSALCISNSTFNHRGSSLLPEVAYLRDTSVSTDSFQSSKASRSQRSSVMAFSTAASSSDDLALNSPTRPLSRLGGARRASSLATFGGSSSTSQAEKNSRSSVSRAKSFAPSSVEVISKGLSTNTVSSKQTSQPQSSFLPHKLPAGAVRYFPAAWVWYQRAAANGHAGAKCNIAAIIMSLGQSSSNFPSFSLPSKSIEVEFALKLWRESADAQNSTAMFNLGLYFERNRGTPSEVLLQTFPNVQALIAASMSSSSSTTNLVSDIMTEQAYEFYQHASDHGIDAAWMGCHRLHLDIERIQGDRQESSIAPELMMRAKIQSRTESPGETIGSEEAAYEVALTFFEGREPVTQNYFKAHQWLLRSVASLVQSIVTSSPLSFSSPFLPPNYLNQLLDSSNCSKFMPHHGKACFQLGVMYDHGLGCKINSSEAMRWLLLAAFFRIPPAMSNLGFMLHMGRGSEVKSDMISSIEWLARAVNLGDSAAEKLLTELMGKEVFECWQNSKLGTVESMLRFARLLESTDSLIFRPDSNCAALWYRQLLGSANSSLLAWLEHPAPMLSISTDLESPASASLNMISFVDPMFGTVLNIFSSHPFLPSIAELEAITSLALLYDQGKVVLASTSDQLNHHQCRRLLEFAAGAGHVPAMHRFSMLLCHQQQSTVNTQNELLALLWLAKAAARGYRPAWSDLIDQLSPYFSNHLDQTLALKRRGSIDLAQPQSLGELKSSKLDLETVSMLLLNAMRGDDSEAMYQLALQLDRGITLMNFPSMPTAAFACFMQASIHGHLAALCNLGVCFDTGRGLYSSSNVSSSGPITQSELAIECFREAAARGNVMAMKNLGVLHEQGRPPFIHRNHVHAMEWYIHAASSGHMLSLMALRRLALNHPDLGLDSAMLEKLASEINSLNALNLPSSQFQSSPNDVSIDVYAPQTSLIKPSVQQSSLPLLSAPTHAPITPSSKSSTVSFSSAPAHPGVSAVERKMNQQPLNHSELQSGRSHNRRISISAFFIRPEQRTSRIKEVRNRTDEELKEEASSLISIASSAIDFLSNFTAEDELKSGNELPLTSNYLDSHSIDLTKSAKHGSAAAEAVSKSRRFSVSSPASSTSGSSEYRPPSRVGTIFSPISLASSLIKLPEEDATSPSNVSDSKSSAFQFSNPSRGGRRGSDLASVLQLNGSTEAVLMSRASLNKFPSLDRLVATCRDLGHALEFFASLEGRCPLSLFHALEHIVVQLERAKQFLVSQRLRNWSHMADYSQEADIESVLGPLLAAQREFAIEIESARVLQAAESENKLLSTGNHQASGNHFPHEVDLISTLPVDEQILRRFGAIMSMVDLFRANSAWDSRVNIGIQVQLPPGVQNLRDSAGALVEISTHSKFQSSPQASLEPVDNPLKSNKPAQQSLLGSLLSQASIKPIEESYESVNEPSHSQITSKAASCQSSSLKSSSPVMSNRRRAHRAHHTRAISFSIANVSLSAPSMKPINDRVEQLLSVSLPSDLLIDIKSLSLFDKNAQIGDVARVYCAQRALVVAQSSTSSRASAMTVHEKLALRSFTPSLSSYYMTSSDNGLAPEARLVNAIVYHEIMLMRRLQQHPRFVRCFGLVVGDVSGLLAPNTHHLQQLRKQGAVISGLQLHQNRISPPTVVLEWMPRGSLYQCLFGKLIQSSDDLRVVDRQLFEIEDQVQSVLIERPPSIEIKWQIAIQIAEGLVHLHQEMKLVHRDLTVHHVLLGEDWSVKLTGCSMVKDLTACVHHAVTRDHHEHADRAPKSSHLHSSSAHGQTHHQAHIATSPYSAIPLQLSPFVLNHYKGSVRSQAPELLLHDDRAPTSYSDMYAFGILLWQLFTGEQPWSGVQHDSAVAGKVMNGKTLPIPVQVPPKIRDVIERCFAFEPEERGTAADALELLQYGLRHHMKKAADSH